MIDKRSFVIGCIIGTYDVNLSNPKNTYRMLKSVLRMMGATAITAKEFKEIMAFMDYLEQHNKQAECKDR